MTSLLMCSLSLSLCVLLSRQMFYRLRFAFRVVHSTVGYGSFVVAALAVKYKSLKNITFFTGIVSLLTQAHL